MFSGNSGMKTTHQRDWSELPPELIELVSKSLNVTALARIKAVCTSWVRAVKHCQPCKSVWLMLPVLSTDHNFTSCRLFDVSGKPGWFYTMTNLLQGFSDSWCIGSSHGWLAIVDPRAVVHLFNPLSGETLALPAFTVCSYNIYRIIKVLSANPSLNADFTLAVLFNDNLSSYVQSMAYCKTRHIEWIILNINELFFQYSDMIFQNDDELFALGRSGHWLYVWNLKGNRAYKRSFRIVPLSTLEPPCIRKGYLVECSGRISVVCWIMSPRPFRTVNFEVLKMNVTKSKLEMEKVECLDDRVLFVGGNQSASLSSRDVRGLDRNSIYFTGDHGPEMLHYRIDYPVFKGGYCGQDLGMYSLEDGIVKRFDEIID